jgi:uncharacterized GH25 family protein
MKRTLLIAAAAAALIATPAFAHSPWLKPSAATVSGEDGWVTFDAAASTDVFNADHQPMQLDQIKAYAPDGVETPIENGMRGKFRSTFDVHLTKPGTWRIGMENTGVQGSYRLDGKDYRVGGRGGGGGPPGGPGGQPRPPGQGGPGGPGGPGGVNANFTMVPGGPDFVVPKGATDVKLTMTSNRNEVLVTLGKPTPLKLSNKGLEMQPITHPADLVADEAGKFRFLVDGKPAANLEVEVIPDGRRFRNAQGGITVKTDAKGEATVKWTGAGLYWMHAAFTDETSPRPGITGRRFQYTTTLEVMAP